MVRRALLLLIVFAALNAWADWRRFRTAIDVSLEVGKQSVREFLVDGGIRAKVNPHSNEFLRHKPAETDSESFPDHVILSEIPSRRKFSPLDVREIESIPQLARLRFVQDELARVEQLQRQLTQEKALNPSSADSRTPQLKVLQEEQRRLEFMRNRLLESK